MTQAADMDYLIDDLKRGFLRMADNQRWYEQEWLGVPIWQLPDDLVRLQAVVSAVQPKWIVETGTKFGGSAIFFASILECLGSEGGGVVTVDIEGYPLADEVFASHRLGRWIKGRIVGDAKADAVVAEIRAKLAHDPGPTLVFLDDWHDAEHVYAEMERYAPLVTPGSYLIVADTAFEDLAGTPIVAPSPKYPDAAKSNPRVAVRRFLAERNDFTQEARFAKTGISNFPDGFLRRR